LDGIPLLDARRHPGAREDRAAWRRKARYSADKFKHIEGAMVSGPLSRECGFSLADIVLAPALRYFDAVDRFVDLCEAVPKLPAWCIASARRPSVADAIVPGYRTTQTNCSHLFAEGTAFVAWPS
jgi:glutathione S-transferase